MKQGIDQNYRVNDTNVTTKSQKEIINSINIIDNLMTDVCCFEIYVNDDNDNMLQPFRETSSETIT